MFEGYVGTSDSGFRVADPIDLETQIDLIGALNR
jgi:hypothetical protein